MDHSWLRTFTLVLLGILAIKWTNGLQVELYSEKNYVGFVDQVHKAPGQDMDCYTLDERFEIKSIKTDKCLMMYFNPNCKGPDPKQPYEMYSFRIYSDTSEFTCLAYGMPSCPYMPWTDYRKTQSFHVCSQERGGGPALDVDYYQDASYNGKPHHWKDVCTCQNIPENIRGGKAGWVSFNNHGNYMEIFSGENCQGDSSFIPAGDNLLSELAPFTATHPYVVASFRPIGLLNCLKLDASIVEFFFQNGTSDPPIPEKVKLATTGNIINDGAATTTQQYQLTESETETVQFTIVKGYTEMNTVGVSASVSVKASAGVPLIGESEITASISTNYQYQKGSSGSNTTTKTASKTTTIQITQTITVPGCHNCTVNAYVNQAKNFPLHYHSYSYITGTAGSTRLSVAEIRANLPPGVDYVKDVDEFTIEAVTEGTMYAEFGINTFMDIDCDKIPNCSPNGVYKGPTSFHYEFPISRKATKKTDRNAKTPQGDKEIGASMGNNWNSLSELS